VSQVKKIAIFNCLIANSCCTGKACLQAFFAKSGFFIVYQKEDVELSAFVRCNGCQHDFDNDAGFAEKIACLFELNIDVIHFGVCTIHNGQECALITKLATGFEAAGIKVVRGTHN